MCAIFQLTIRSQIFSESYHQIFSAVLGISTFFCSLYQKCSLTWSILFSLSSPRESCSNCFNHVVNQKLNLKPLTLKNQSNSFYRARFVELEFLLWELSEACVSLFVISLALKYNALFSRSLAAIVFVPKGVNLSEFCTIHLIIYVFLNNFPVKKIEKLKKSPHGFSVNLGPNVLNFFRSILFSFTNKR